MKVRVLDEEVQIHREPVLTSPVVVEVRAGDAVALFLVGDSNNDVKVLLFSGGMQNKFFTLQIERAPERKAVGRRPGA